MNIIESQIRGDLQRNQKPVADVSREMKISQKTLSRRMSDPETFTVKELLILRKYITQETLNLIIPERRKT